MKHLRKIATVIIAVIMIASIAVGIGVIYAVRNVNVTFMSYTGEPEEEILAVKQSVLDGCRGRLISSVDEEDVASCLAGEYVLESFEKVLPCTLNITVKQRKEVFAVFDGEKYSIYDDSGTYLRTTEKNANANDGAPNLILTGVDGESDVKTVASVCSVFKSAENFGSLRSLVCQVKLYKRLTDIQTDSDRITFYLWSGLSIEIRDFSKDTSEKIKKVYKFFCGLKPEQTMSGQIICREDVASDVQYNPYA